MRTFLPAAVAALLAACASSAPPGRAAAPASTGDVAITWAVDTETTVPREGGLVPLTFSITNRAKDVVVLRTLRYLAPAAGESAPAATWQFARGGDLRYDSTRNEWRYDRRRRGKGAPVFNSGLLMPGETVVVRTTIRLIHLPRTYHLLYFRLKTDELRQKVYWEVREDRELRYVSLFGDALRSRLWAYEDKDKTGHRVVVFPHAEIVDTARSGAHIQLVRVSPTPVPRAFGLDRAVARAGGGRPENHTFSEALDGWILSRGGALTLVTPRGMRPLPRIRRLEPFFFYVDRVGVGKVEIEFLKETKSLFADQYRLVADPTEGRFYLFLQPVDLLPFLDAVRDTGLDLDVQHTAQGGGRIVVTR